MDTLPTIIIKIYTEFIILLNAMSTTYYILYSIQNSRLIKLLLKYIVAFKKHYIITNELTSLQIWDTVEKNV